MPARRPGMVDGAKEEGIRFRTMIPATKRSNERDLRDGRTRLSLDFEYFLMSTINSRV